ncbi:MAG: thioredoxin family protein [Solirubrobacterales bacterium]|nr:thioredoxin family protein [Solirubrobacterales bacterium]
MRIELFFFDGCPNYEALLAHLRDLANQRGFREEIVLRRVLSSDDAEAVRFLGSPSVRVDGEDVEPGANAREDYGLKCRLYSTLDGLRGSPPDEMILSAFARHSADTASRMIELPDPVLGDDRDERI